MAKKHTFGKLLAFTTTAAAVGGACYVFRDQIKQSAIYQKSIDTFADLTEKLSKCFHKEDEDFVFDDMEESEGFCDFEEDETDKMFSDASKKNREYTSITINAKEEDKLKENTSDAATVNTTTNLPKDTPDSDSLKEAVRDIPDITPKAAPETEEPIPTIHFGASSPATTPAQDTTTSEADTTKEDIPTGYEYENLSDVSEDPDVLEEQDKLDF